MSQDLDRRNWLRGALATAAVALPLSELVLPKGARGDEPTFQESVKVQKALAAEYKGLKDVLATLTDKERDKAITLLNEGSKKLLDNNEPKDESQKKLQRYAEEIVRKRHELEKDVDVKAIKIEVREGKVAVSTSLKKGSEESTLQCDDSETVILLSANRYLQGVNQQRDLKFVPLVKEVVATQLTLLAALPKAIK